MAFLIVIVVFIVLVAFGAVFQIKLDAKKAQKKAMEKEMKLERDTVYINAEKSYVEKSELQNPALNSTSMYKDFGLMEVVFPVVGLKYDNDDGTSRQEILLSCKKGNKIELKRTPTEQHPNAIQVHVKKGCIGYISEEDNKTIAKYLDNGGEIYDAQISFLMTNSKGIINVCEIYFQRHKMR